jgi:membrane associated rhomboid family serine protease
VSLEQIPGTLVLGLMLVAVHQASCKTCGSTLGPRLWLYPALVRQGEIWRLLTSLFLHMNFVHLAVNCLLLVQLGLHLEPLFGVRNFLYLLLLFGILSHGLFWLVAYVLAQAGFGLGAWHNGTVGLSGAILAVFVTESRLCPLTRPLRIPGALYPWVVLVLMMVVGVRASPLAHLCGMAIGYAHTVGAFAKIAPAVTVERQGYRGHGRRLGDKNE